MARTKMTDEQKRKNRLARNKKNQMTVKADQVGVCRFVDIQSQLFSKDDKGGWHRVGSEILHGLQYENKVLVTDGRIKHLNASSARIVTVYDTVPTWATPYMIELKFNNFFFDEPIVF